jgi:hypothetical protein
MEEGEAHLLFLCSGVSCHSFQGAERIVSLHIIQDIREYRVKISGVKINIGTGYVVFILLILVGVADFCSGSMRLRRVLSSVPSTH